MQSGFLTAKEIINESNLLFKDGFVKDQAVGASYDLGLGEEVYITGHDYPLILSEEKPFVTIPRGQFALLMTKEYITMPPDYLAFISIRFSKKAQGLINVSGFHVDPGFQGKILFSVFNAGPTDFVLRYGEGTFMIFFYKLNYSAGEYTGERNFQKHLPVNLVTSLRGSSASLADVDKRLNQLETREKIYWAILIALVTALIALFFKAFG